VEAVNHGPGPPGELLNFAWNVFEGTERFREGEPIEHNWINRRGSEDFAALVDNEVGDSAAMALRNAANQSGNLAAVLDDLAAQAREDAQMWMRVHTTRARTRTAIRVICGATVAMLLGLLVVAGDYLAPYQTLAGQAILAVAFVLFGIALWWMHRLAAPPEAPSFLRLAVEAGQP
jgi:undecaprenyl pyrophosphate phosphatase UppP